MSIDIFQEKVLPASDKLFRFASRLLENEEDARDIVQEVMLKMWKNSSLIHRYQNVEAWCMQIAKNLCLDKLKAGKVRENSKTEIMKAQAVTESITPYQQLEHQDQQRLVGSIMNALPEKQKMAVQLRDIEGFSYKEIADILEIDMNEVKVNIFRARKTLKENLLKINVYGL
ncbi:MAG TPA: sigma-70 family RNA polymerase sigma factor [Chitinophagaceae bacterium]